MSNPMPPYPLPAPGEVPGQLTSAVPYAPPVDAPDCPPGLGYLLQVDQLIIKQKVEYLEIITGFETSNQYTVLNKQNQVLYQCAEDSNFCARQCLKSSRPFFLHVVDSTGAEVIRIHRPYKCSFCCECCSCFKCCQDEVRVEAPIGETVGFVKQICSGCSIAYDILDADRQVILKICGPSYFHCKCFGDIKFHVKSRDETQEVGMIAKKWSGFVQEYFTDADTFGVTFPVDLDVRMKAVVLAAVFLIDFMYFEDNTQG